MSEVVITVRGEHEERITPERAVAHLTIRAEGPERGAVVERMAALSEPVRDDLAARKSAGGLIEWTSQRVSVWSERPWNNEGKRLAPVHYASVDFSVTFADFAALSWWAGDVAERDGVQFGWIDWQLTPETRSATERAIAAGAVGVAVARATAYAGAIGLSSVTPLEIADLGLLTRGEAHESAAAPRMLMAKASFDTDGADGGGPAVQLQPEDIVISAAVEARFVAR
ncbi:SIMPL domain-containing protein [Microbacterium sp. 2FI]|uniref:SIMPL domain-containing protein n=1 Tax=Microbacterium sp. 2FI TaxID=2502193 RepID=UPI0010F6CFC0|nr:SIMPL domain-containing protein [Microbacterium sp. 2FI]